MVIKCWYLVWMVQYCMNFCLIELKKWFMIMVFFIVLVVIWFLKQMNWVIQCGNKCFLRKFVIFVQLILCWEKMVFGLSVLLIIFWSLMLVRKMVFGWLNIICEVNLKMIGFFLMQVYLYLVLLFLIMVICIWEGLIFMVILGLWCRFLNWICFKYRFVCCWMWMVMVIKIWLYY